MWLLGRLAPDFKTIADFRKFNADIRVSRLPPPVDQGVVIATGIEADEIIPQADVALPMIGLRVVELGVRSYQALQSIVRP
jgi:hypothetical protein